jgi:hypothetical protein
MMRQRFGNWLPSRAEIEAMLAEQTRFEAQAQEGRR